MRLAIIESNHWHVPLYLNAIENSGCKVVAVSDSTSKTDQALALRFGSQRYASYLDLLEREKIDFAFVFGRHVDMPEIAGHLIRRRIPFAIEKPCGINTEDVQRLAKEANDANVYVSVPFIFRMHDIYKIISRGEKDAVHGIDHASFRFLAGPPDRYEKAGTPWMLDPATAGGGPLINVGIHFVDLFRILAREPIASVSAAGTNHIYGKKIEDYISVRMRTKSDQICTLECGYSFPSTGERQRELTASIRSSTAMYVSEGDGMFVRSIGGETSLRELARMETDIYYSDYVKLTLEEVRGGRSPFAGLHDAAAALRVVNAAYRSASQGGIPIHI
jgi:predicted dehydrogenase